MKRKAFAVWVVLAAAMALVLARESWAQAVPSGDCTVTVDNSTPLALHLSLRPGAVLCLRGGTYPVDELQLQAAGQAGARITLRSYPGETAVLQATTGGVARVLGSYWTLLNVVLDNQGLNRAALTIAPTGDHFELLDSEVRNGTYYGVDIFGAEARIEGNQLHDFRPPTRDTSADGERHCLATHSGASGLVVRGNTIFDCWGDGLQMYEPDNYKDPSEYAHNVLIENNTFQRGSALAYASNAIDIKGVVGAVIRSNDISGYALPSLPLLHPDQAAVELHHGAQDVLIENNRIRDGYEGIEINSTIGGQLVGVVIRNNELRHLVNYGIDLDGLYQGGQVQNNTLADVAGNALQIAGQGLVNSQVDHNLIIGSGPSKIYPGAVLHGASLGPNAWFSSARSDALANSADVVGSGDPGPLAGFGLPLVAPAWEPYRPAHGRHLGRCREC